MGKSYAQRNPVKDNDLYHTPVCLTKKLLEVESFRKKIKEPACGDHAISTVLIDSGFTVDATDLTDGSDFLLSNQNLKGMDIITNPPFMLWDEFVNKAKESGARKIAFIGRGNYLGTVDRYNTGIFKGLKAVYFFNRYVDYRTPRREDGQFHVGAMLSGWFVWQKGYRGKPNLGFIDVQEFTKLGQYRDDDYEVLEFLTLENEWTPNMVLNSQFRLELMYSIEREFSIEFTATQLDNVDSIGKLLAATRAQRRKLKK